MRTRRQVIIVGGGPVGVGLAVDLGQRGISSILVERRIGMHKIPKGQNLSQRTLERFYFWDCLEELRAQRLLPPSVPVAGVTAYEDLLNERWHIFAGRESVNDLLFSEMPAKKDQPPPDLRYFNKGRYETCPATMQDELDTGRQARPLAVGRLSTISSIERQRNPGS